MPPILLLIIILCDSAPLPASSISTLREELCKNKKNKKTVHGCCCTSFQFWAGIMYSRRVSGRFLGVPDCGAPNKSNILALKKKFLVLDGTATRNCPETRRISWRYLGHSTASSRCLQNQKFSKPRIGSSLIQKKCS